MVHVRMQPRRLASVVVPAAGESFPSWLDRLAIHHDQPPGAVAHLLGLDLHAGDAVRPELFGITLTTAARTRIHAATGLPHQSLDATHLTTYHGTVLDLGGLTAEGPPPLPKLLPADVDGRLAFVTVDPWTPRHPREIRRQEWWLSDYSRVCPACLADSHGVWQLWWRLGAAAACPIHKLLLVDACDRCGNPIRGGGHRAPGTLLRSSPARPMTCGNHIYKANAACYQRLDQLPRLPVPDIVVDAQRDYLRAAASTPPPLRGKPAPARHWAAMFVALATLARQALHRQARRFLPPGLPQTVHEAVAGDATLRVKAAHRWVRQSEGPPPSAGLAAAMIAVVGPIIALADPTTMDQEIQELTEAGYGKHAPFAIHALARADRMRRDDRDHYNQAVHRLQTPAVEFPDPHMLDRCQTAHPSPQSSSAG